MRFSVFMNGNFLGYIWMDLYRFALVDQAGLRLVVFAESRN